MARRRMTGSETLFSITLSSRIRNRDNGCSGVRGARLGEDRPPAWLEHAVDFAKGRGVGRQVVQGVHAQHAVEAAGDERQRLSPRRDERGVVAEHQAAVGGQTLAAAPHHFNRQIDRDRSDSEAAEKLRGPARAGGEVQDEVVGARGEQLARDGEVEQIVPALLRGRPVQRKVEAGRRVLLLVGARFGLVRGASDARNVPVFPRGQFFRAHRADATPRPAGWRNRGPVRPSVPCVSGTDRTAEPRGAQKVASPRVGDRRIESFTVDSIRRR